MPWSIDLRQPVKEMLPISEEEADRLAEQVHREAEKQRGIRLSDIPEEKKFHRVISLLKEAQEFHIAVVARQFTNAADNWFHERNVVEPAEDLFAKRHGFRVKDLEQAAYERNNGIHGMIFRDEKLRKAGLRDAFFGLVDMVRVGEEGYESSYDSFIAGMTPETLSKLVQERLDAEVLVK